MNGKKTDKVLICGLDPDDIRKAYHSGKIGELLDGMMSVNNPSLSELNNLEEYLITLKKEREAVIQQFKGYEETSGAPSVDELMGLTEEKKLKRTQWIAEKKKEIARAKEIVAKAYTAGKGRKATEADWLDMAMELATLQFSLDQYRVVADQMFRAKLTRIIDNFDVSRAEAEERAKLTQEYREYKEAVLFRDMVEEVIKIMKKWAGINS